MRKTFVCCLPVLMALTALAAELPRLAPEDARGETILVRGRVLDGESRAVVGVEVFAYHADHQGRYHEEAYRGTVRTDGDGGYAFETSRPGGYGPAPHIHFRVSAAGFRDAAPTFRLKDETVPRRKVEYLGQQVEEFTYDIRLKRQD
ncbi:MAG: hypothetical protein GTN89_15960 [Acidobacteria bacterium]|nr:hypothetical protein [Acidobacteriota bacterium]NIM62529.1 hypothetical protein [Acidobacteriota bacterium]NIO60735.1 hypothetical protein [Acidobacteriota bacterium]NIQ31798.1 hypothetical protein [Acidobacteriota bacterium]NIQ86656.1 hypothetical protein [Acidobacteriota bacterium]